MQLNGPGTQRPPGPSVISGVPVLVRQQAAGAEPGQRLQSQPRLWSKGGKEEQEDELYV